MKKSYRQLSDYQLFFEEIGPKLNRVPGSEDQVSKQNDDYEKSPSLSENQINLLREDLKALGGDKESPAS